MKTAEEREKIFRGELATLLLKHNAELNIGDDGRSYGMHSGIAEITMPSEWGADGVKLAEYTEFRI
jgi:hypothetical protein